MAYALITGASSGIGRELASLFAANGYDIVITARNQERLNTVQTALKQQYQVRVVVFAADLSEPDAPQRLHDFTTSHGISIEYLVNNAGSYRYGRDMRRAGHGRILNISSVASMMAGPYMAVYFASKAFVRSLSEAVAYELRNTGVTVTCVCPGPTTTGFAKAANMHGRNFFTMTRPASARQLAAYAYRRMMRGTTLAYHGPLTRAGALAERLLPRAAIRRLAAFMNGGEPNSRSVSATPQAHPERSAQD